ncbi:MAG: hypothetical protein APU95_02730 [Hadesarchaea archaeon YNP_N21]|jgi:isopentenyl phosphate kinase|nr:MAG: hypothetical protein APU95_02730 [Hadesarchaea archaeon YNP_N21]
MNYSNALIVKLGGSVITDKRKKFSIRRRTVERLAKELATSKVPLIVVHGGGSFGHPVASEYEINKGYKRKRQLIGFSLTHRAMEKLNSFIIDSLHKAGLPAIAFQPSACFTVVNGRIKSAMLEPLRKMLDLGLIPVLYGDAVPDLAKGMCILSGDQIVAFLARELGVKRVILGVDIDGVYTSDPTSNKNARPIPVISPKNWRGVSCPQRGVMDVTGGIRSKVDELLALAEHGAEAEIINASRPGILKRAIAGEKGLGTRIVGDSL